LDDILIVPVLMRGAVKSIPPEILNTYKEEAKVEFREGTPKSYKAAIIIVMVWVLILSMIIYWTGDIFQW